MKWCYHSQHLILPEAHHLLIVNLHAWGKSLRTDASIPVFQWKWCFYTSVQVKEMPLSATSHSSWIPPLADNTPTCLKEMFLNWCFYTVVLVKETNLSDATSHSSWSPLSVLRSSLVQFLDHNWPQLQLQPVETKASFSDNWTKLYRTSSHRSSCSISTGFNQSSLRLVETSSHRSYLGLDRSFYTTRH